jgi:CheY-like chemotaxis protein
MVSTKEFHWLIIDDSKLDCFMAEKIIKNTDHCKTVRSFLKAKEALGYIKTAPVDKEIGTIVLVDLQMPIMNGLEFAEELDKLPREITGNFKIVMIFSTVNKFDLEKFRLQIKELKLVTNLTNKPLTSNTLSQLIS